MKFSSRGAASTEISAKSYCEDQWIVKSTKQRKYRYWKT